MPSPYVRPQWWIFAVLGCILVFIIGLFVPNALGYPLVTIAVIGAVVLIYLDYKGKRDAGLSR